MPRTRSGVSELALIRSIRERAQSLGREVALGIGDDCALLTPPAGHEIAITTDFCLENVHFRRDWHPPESVGHRCLARGLSDLAAMGARPLGALLSLALPPELASADGSARSWADRFLDGFLALAAIHKTPLIGGDTARAPGRGRREKGGLVVADVVLIGAVKRAHALLRSGAVAGDNLYVTGTVGGAAAELLALEQAPASFLNLTTAAPGHPHLYPQPRVAVGLGLTGLATAAIDLSDGVSTDLMHLCEESDLAAEIDRLPIHPLALHLEGEGRAPSALHLALNGGEDYELLFTASPRTRIPSKIEGVPIHRIGKIKRRGANRPLVALRVERPRAGGSELVPLEPHGWQH